MEEEGEGEDLRESLRASKYGIKKASLTLHNPYSLTSEQIGALHNLSKKLTPQKNFPFPASGGRPHRVDKSCLFLKSFPQ